MKHLWRIVALVCAVALVAAACGDDSDDSSSDVSSSPTTTAAEETTTTAAEETTTTVSDDCSDEAVLCVGLVTDVGEVDDRSFNQAAWEGVQMVQEANPGSQILFVETQDAKDYANNINLFIEDDYDFIVTVGFALGEATVEAAQANPDVKFIGVDQFQGETVDNLAGLIFPEDRAGFLAGALAGLLTTSNKIAAVLGTDLVPPVVAFNEGYRAGAEYVNPEIEVESTYHPGGLDVAFTDPEWGAATAAQVIDQGADVIFGAGGKTGNGALIETAGNEGLYCIGVDTDQWHTVPEARSCLISSALKLIQAGVSDLVADFQAGNFVGEVGLAPHYDFESEIPAEVTSRIEEIDAGLRDGSIETGYNPGG